MKHLVLFCIVFLSVLFGSEYYGAIEIGGKGVKAYVIESDADQTRIVSRNGINTAPQSGIDAQNELSQEMIANISRDVKTLWHTIDQKYVILPQHRYVVASSAIHKIHNKKALNKAIFEAIKQPLYYIDEEEESRYGFYGTVPVARWTSSVMIDIGGGNTKIAWLDAHNRFRYREIPLGTVSSTTLSKNHSQPASLNHRCLLTLEPYRSSLEGVPQKESLYLIGGIFWVTAYFKNDGTLDAYTALNVDDFETMIRTYLRQHSQQNCGESTSEKTCFLLRYYGADNIVCGAVIAKELVDYFRKTEHILFAKDGAWIIGWLLQRR